MVISDHAPPFAKYNADGTGRDTYIRRDPVECYGKTLYKPEPRLVTRFGAAGSVLPRDRPRHPGKPDLVGGPNKPVEKPPRYLSRPANVPYPVKVTKFSTMKARSRPTPLAPAFVFCPECCDSALPLPDPSRNDPPLARRRSCRIRW